MKPEYIKHIFEPFSRADDSRIGQGARQQHRERPPQKLISMMDGDIQVESEWERGPGLRSPVPG
ncbi:MAG: hypothetical protein ACLTBV_16765 [Enterocloster bolteae]